MTRKLYRLSILLIIISTLGCMNDCGPSVFVRNNSSKTIRLYLSDEPKERSLSEVAPGKTEQVYKSWFTRANIEAKFIDVETGKVLEVRPVNVGELGPDYSCSEIKLTYPKPTRSRNGNAAIR